jgi:HK97 family phage major capsid protein
LDETEDVQAFDTRTLTFDTEVVVRDAAKREIDVRVVPWDTPIETVDGTEEFARGALTGPGFDVSRVMLMGLEHEVHLGVGQTGKVVPTRRVHGKAIATEDRPDGQYATVRVARTQAGDEIMALAADGIVTGVSLEMHEIPGGTEVQVRNGRKHRIHRQVVWSGVAPTYRPAYRDAAILAVRAQEAPVTEQQAVAETTATTDIVALGDRLEQSFGTAIAQLGSVVTQSRSESDKDLFDRLLGRIDKLEESARASIEIPSRITQDPTEDFGRGQWMQMVLRVMSGEAVNQKELQARVAADLVTADNLGVIPRPILNTFIGVIDKSRPFLESTRRIDVPSAGMQLSVPVITTRPTVGVQTDEKDELASTPTSITRASYDPTTIGGYGDISLQLLKRSDPSYLAMYTDLLGEAYAIMADDKAVDALLAASGVHNGGSIDPSEGAQFGDAWAFAAAVSRSLIPDTVWMSSAAVAAFIDAKSDTTNTPLYADLAASFTAGGGVGGRVSGLRPVHVPALDDESSDIIVGPSRGFAWAEDGTYTLQVDVPAKAGRDVGIVGMIWYAPLYPTAFTRYALAS